MLKGHEDKPVLESTEKEWEPPAGGELDVKKPLRRWTQERTGWDRKEPSQWHNWKGHNGWLNENGPSVTYAQIPHPHLLELFGKS